MSHIFDGLQKSESSLAGSNTPVPTDATELLRQMERRATSTWEAAHIETPVPLTGAVRVKPFGRRSATADAVVAQPPLANDNSAPEEADDHFADFQRIPISAIPQNRLICVTDNESPAAEAFRLLGVRLRDLRRKRPLKKVLITSTIPQEGKSLVSANLACTLALRVPERTLLIEGDLRRPSLSKMFGIGTVPGLSEYLQGERTLMDSIYHLEAAGTWILPAGNSPNNSLELLQSRRLPEMMDQLAEWFDWVIIDSPPILPLADASVWMRSADGVLLIARQGTTEKRQLQSGLEAIEPKKLIGALLNGSNNPAHNSYYYYRKPDESAPNRS